MKEAREAFQGLVVAALTLDEAEHDDAVVTAFRAAVLTGRRRLWVLLRRRAPKGLAAKAPPARAGRECEPGGLAGPPAGAPSRTHPPACS